MGCYFCTVKSGRLILLEHEAARWLDFAHLYDVDWLPADQSLLPQVREKSICEKTVNSA